MSRFFIILAAFAALNFANLTANVFHLVVEYPSTSKEIVKIIDAKIKSEVPQVDDISLLYSNSELDFGSICAGAATSMEFSVQNESVVSAEITKVYLKSGNSFYVQTDLKTPAEIEPEQIFNMDVFFTPTEPNIFEDSLIIEYALPEYERVALHVSGTGVKPGSEIRIPHLSGSVGESDFKIPITAKLNCNSAPLKLQFRTELRMKFGLFKPTYFSGAKLIDEYVENGEHVWVLENEPGIKLDSREHELFEAVGVLLYGNDEHTPVRLENFDWKYPGMQVESEVFHGGLTLRGCALNLHRTELYVPTKLRVNPSPASDDFFAEIESEETGTFIFEIYSSDGRLLRNESWTAANGKPFVKTFHFDAADFTNGLYFATLRSPYGIVETLPLPIVK